jgi:predicted DsbA family dithiol-disulfide isomerase
VLTLLDVAAEAGLDRHEADAMLNRGDGLGAVQDADALARRFGVDGVPFFIVNGTLALSGAQQPDAFLEAFQRAAAKNEAQ